MTRRRRGALVPAVLVALAAGAGTAGVTTILAAPEVSDGTPNAVALYLTAPASPTDAPGADDASEPTTGSEAPPTTTSAAPETTEVPTTTTEAPAPPTTTTTTKTTTKAAPPPSTTTPPRQVNNPPAPGGGGGGSAADSVLAIVNQERSSAGCSAVSLNAALNTASRNHSVDMSRNDYFSHVSQDGRSFVDRAKAAGYQNPGGENIAMGQRTPEQVMKSWMDSSGHRANILNCSFKTMGLGLATDGYYWTQMFGY